jgi:hypothetical protein
MEWADEIASGGMMYIPRFRNSKVVRGNKHTDTQAHMQTRK